MPQRKTIKDLQGNELSGEVIEVLETTSRASDVKLADGTILRVQIHVAEVLKVDDKWDSEGNPMYNLRSGTLISVYSCPPELKKGMQ